MDHHMRKFQSSVEQAAACSGAGTELVTVWIPSDKNITSVMDRLRGERAESENIKSKHTRDRVAGALERAINVIHKYNNAPNNGLVVCAGYVDGEYVTFEYNDLPEPIRDSKYQCSDEFAVDALMEMAFGGSTWWGLITVTRDTASLGRYTNTSHGYVDVIDSFESRVMGKSQAGGQSQTRFERLRKEQRENHYEKTAKIAVREFSGDDFQGLALGGPNVTVGDFIDHLPQPLQDAIVTVETVDHAGAEESLTTLARLAEPAFEEEEKQHERSLVEEFKRGLTGDTPVVYGEDNVQQALDYDAVDTLLVSADFAPTYIDTWAERARNQGGSVEIISTMHEEGYQLDSVFGGLAALLRFDIN